MSWFLTNRKIIIKMSVWRTQYYQVTVIWDADWRVNIHQLNTLHANDVRTINEELLSLSSDNITQRIMGNTYR